LTLAFITKRIANFCWSTLASLNPKFVNGYTFALLLLIIIIGFILRSFTCSCYLRYPAVSSFLCYTAAQPTLPFLTSFDENLKIKDIDLKSSGDYYSNSNLLERRVHIPCLPTQIDEIGSDLIFEVFLVQQHISPRACDSLILFPL